MRKIKFFNILLRLQSQGNKKITSAQIGKSDFFNVRELPKRYFEKTVDGVELSYFLYSVGEADTLLIPYSLLLITSYYFLKIDTLFFSEK